jgi:S-adenosylmethionine:tRNA ribosyltransferase-isomerase
MHLNDFDYDLPEHLIAQQPLPDRSASRLLRVPRDASAALSEHVFRDLPELLRPDDVLVFNNSKVLPARLWASKPTGARVELLLERLLNDHSMLCQARSNRKLQIGNELLLGAEPLLKVEGRIGSFFHVSCAQPLLQVLHEHGHMPLPPYIKRADNALDNERYQTVYAREPGSVAAPTAGLHFDDELLQRLDAMGVQRVEVTLHVGAGTFQPVRSDDITAHEMHAEWYQVSAAAAATIHQARAAGRRIVAVGTTSLRTLESAVDEAGQVIASSDESRLFIYPGYRFRCIDALITNFHLPRSTLMMLVAALAGHQRIMAAYHHAVAAQFRFFSYGDAMLID